MEYLNHMNEKTKESRALFLGWCKMHRLTILNSQFSKPPDKFITHKEKTNDSDFGPPITAERYAQIDYWLTYSDWKNSCTNVQSRRDIAFDSDHVLLESCVYMKLYEATATRAGNQKKTEVSQTYPTTMESL